MSVDVVPSSRRSLAELAEIANYEHQQVIIHLGSALHHAIKAGEALYEAHLQIGTEEGWRSWCKENLGISGSTAGRYERLAFYRDQLPPEAFEPYVDAGGTVRQPSANRAIEVYIRGLPLIHDIARSRRGSPELRAEVRRLRKQGVTYPDISEMLGISPNTIACYSVPGFEDRQIRKARERLRRRQAARRALAEQEERQRRDRLAKDNGGVLADAYSLVRRAIQKTDAGNARKALTYLHRAEDEIVKAMKESK